MSTVEINWEKLGLGRGSAVTVDGKNVGHVTAVKIDMSVGDTPRVVIECVAPDAYVLMDEADVIIEPRVLARARES